MSECVFCRIVAGEMGSEEVASSSLTFAFRDIDPAMPSHVLVVPREHIESAASLGPDHAALLAEMFETAQEVAAHENLDERGYRLVLNVGEDAQNSVAHLHMHVLGGRPMNWPPG
ncbi:MAG TPA: HIT domain-containing protein [Acidimicrobiales bacterium]|nr:HIT domain-containing protein [Acidimicrobiales bacterium]